MKFINAGISDFLFSMSHCSLSMMTKILKRHFEQFLNCLGAECGNDVGSLFCS